MPLVLDQVGLRSGPARTRYAARQKVRIWSRYFHEPPTDNFTSPPITTFAICPAPSSPGSRACFLDDFRRQAKALPEVFEMATLESAIEFLTGKYTPRRDLCLMTFDDGLREHYADVTPILAEEQIQGFFFVITGCLEDGVVAPVHMNHFLMAHLGFDVYRLAFEKTVQDLAPAEPAPDQDGWIRQFVSERIPSIRWKSLDFKYLFNFVLPPRISATCGEGALSKVSGGREGVWPGTLPELGRSARNAAGRNDHGRPHS